MRGGVDRRDRLENQRRLDGVSNPVVVADTVFGLSTKARGQFFAVDATSGARAVELGSPREAENTAVVKAETSSFC